MDIGAKLKEARLSSGLSLDSLQETTKIQKRYLIAIEEGNLHILPGKFYARAFIKEYANAVGLDPSELVEEYKEEIPSTDEENVQYSRLQRTRKESHADKGAGISSLIPTIIVVLLIIGILLVAWWFIRENSSDDNAEQIEDPQENNVIITNPGDTESGEAGSEADEEGNDTDGEQGSEEDNAADETEEEQSGVEITVTEEGTGASPESTLELTNAGDEVMITLESADADSHTWLEIRDEDTNESYYNASFNADSSPTEIDVSDSESIYFNIGNAPALTILVNGVEMEYPTDPSQYVHQHLHLNINKAE